MKIKYILTAILILLNVSNSYATEINKNISKFGQRFDNNIDTELLFHEENEDYRVESEKNLKIFLKTKNKDIYSAELIYGNHKKIMESIGSYGGNEIFMAEVPKGNFQYYFELNDGNIKYIYGKDNNTKKFKYTLDNKFTNIPEWSKGLVGYYIYIDSFRNGNIDNDPIYNELGTDGFLKPSGELRSGTNREDLVEDNWNIEASSEFNINEWNSNYEKLSDWEENIARDTKHLRYYGGDLQGINEKLDYLKKLGVDYIILSSPFYSDSNHKNDSIYLNHIDPYFGHLEQTGVMENTDINSKIYNENGSKELKLLSYDEKNKKNFLNEDMRDSSTWIWTESDLELIKLIKNAHRKNIRVVLEVALDRVSENFFANIENISDWYLDKDKNILNLNNLEVKKYIEDSMKKWIVGLDGTLFSSRGIDDGIDGIKYVYYDEKNKEKLEELTNSLKNLKKDFLLIGDFSRELNKDIKNGIYDSNVDYNIVNNLIKYIVNTDENYRINGTEFATRLNEIYSKYDKERFFSSQILLSSSDTDRIYSSIINPNRIFDRNNKSKQGYIDIRPDLYSENAVKKLKQIVGIQMMLPASPVIYYGDEKGMWGSDYPRNRKPMLWEDYLPHENETDNIDKYIDVLKKLNNKVEVNEVQKIISYPVEINEEIKKYYETLFEIRKNHKKLFGTGKFRILEVYGEEKTKMRVDSQIKKYLEEEKRKAKIYRNQEILFPTPDIDFVTFEIFNKKESMIVVINNSKDSYPLSLKVPKLFGFYRNKLNKKENYLISDKEINVILKPYEIKILYSNDSGIIDAF